MKKLLAAISGMYALAIISVPNLALAASESTPSAEEAGSVGRHFGVLFLMFAIVLIVGKIGNFVERYGQPAVIGELLAGIVLALIGYWGWDLIDQIRSSEVMAYLASFGALILLFSIGLESQIKEMKKVGVAAFMVAVIGVILPFVAGAFVLGPLFYADENLNSRLFLGAALVATSVGITASVFRSLGISRTRAAQTVLGAAIVDDVLGLIVLAIVSALATGGSVTPGLVLGLALKSFGFLAGALIIGSISADKISKLFSKINPGIGMKTAVALSFALLFGYLAELFGLEPIIGAFAAGLLLDAVHFNYFADPVIVNDLRELEFEEEKDREKVMRLINKHKHAHVEDVIGNLGLFFVPIFFVYTGLQIDISSLLEPDLYIYALIIAIVAVLCKMAAGIAAKGKRDEKLLVGMSMVPRGEVGLIFAATGKALGVLSNEMFSVIILVVIITTFVAPPFIRILSRRYS